VRRACRDRTKVTVIAAPHDPDRPLRIIMPLMPLTAGMCTWRLGPYADAENCGNSAASLEIVAAVAASSSASGLRGVPAGNPRALSAVLMAGMNGADMIASISG
jgi:hypothetical protein